MEPSVVSIPRYFYDSVPKIPGGSRVIVDAKLENHPNDDGESGYSCHLMVTAFTKNVPTQRFEVSFESL